METQTAIKTTWGIDPAHSEVQFKVKHLVISTVTGFFRKFEGEVYSESEDFDGAEVSFKLDAASIDTNQADRDQHLRSEDFFAADTYPQLVFEKGKLHKVGGDYLLKGNLSIRDVSKPIEMKATYGGLMIDPYGNTKVGFEVMGSISRKAFGLQWNGLTESGGVVVGDEVKLLINVQLLKK